MNDKFDILAVGNAIVDVMGQCEDSFISDNGLTKGAMRLIDEEEAERLYKSMDRSTEISGGSAANTMTGIACLGGQSAFVGKVAHDELGEKFRTDIQESGVDFQTRPLENGAATARSMILITPDAQRTMNTFLGASVEFSEDDIDPDYISNAKIIYLEGYLFDREKAKKAFEKTARLAKINGSQVALTLSDLFCVERHREDFKNLIKDVDILFANHEEAMALYETDDIEHALACLQKDVSIAAVTFSADGSVILSGDKRYNIAAHDIAEVVDTTGAGDLYAAGFLYGYSKGLDLDHCGQIASITAAEIVSHIGARPKTDLKSYVDDNLPNSIMRSCA